MKRLSALLIPRPRTQAAACGFLVALPALPAQAQNCVPPPAGLIAWWPFDNSANDIVGSNNPPSSSGAVSYAPGKVGTGVDINLTPLGISILKTPSMNLLGSDFSIDAWVKLTKRGQGYIFLNYGGVPYYHLYITAQGKAATGFRPGVAIVSPDGSDPKVEAIGNTTLNVGQWYHLVGVRSGATATQAGATASIYVNGKLDAPPVTNSAVLSVNGGSVDTGASHCLYARIGAVNTGPGHCTSPTASPAESFWQFPGVIDEVEIFNRALTQAEILDIYTKGKCKPLPMDAKGMTWLLGAANATTGTVTVGCGNPPNRCDPIAGDRPCTDSLPLLCFKPLNLPVPASVNNTDVNNRWSGGIIGTTAPVQASSFGGLLANANARCIQEFKSSDWRVAEFHDGAGWNFQAYGNAGTPTSRFWVHINDQPKGTCFPNK